MVLSVFFRTEDPACLLFFHFGNFLEAGWSSTTKLTLASALLEGTDVRFANGHGRCTSHVRFVPKADMTDVRY